MSLIKVRRLGFVTSGGHLSSTPDEPSDEHFDESCDDHVQRLEYATKGGQLVDTAFSAFVKKENDSGIFPISNSEFDSNQKLLSIKKENDYGEKQFADFNEDEYEEFDKPDDANGCFCEICLKKEIPLISENDWQTSLQNRIENAAEIEVRERFNAAYKEFIEDLIKQNSKTVHRHGYTVNAKVKIVYECTFNDCKNSFSSLKTAFLHIRIRHLNLMPTLAEQKKQQNKVETDLPPELQPITYIHQTTKHLDGFLLTDEDQVERFEKVFQCTDRPNFYERENMAFNFKICESIILAWFEKRRRSEAGLRKKKSNLEQSRHLSNEANQTSSHSVTTSIHSSTLELANSHPLPSTSSRETDLGHSTQANSPADKHNTLFRILQYFSQGSKNKKEVKKIVKEKLKKGKIIAPTAAKQVCQSVIKTSTGCFICLSTQFHVQAIQSNSPISQTANTDNHADAQNSHRSTNTSDNISETTMNRTSKSRSTARNGHKHVLLDNRSSNKFSCNKKTKVLKDKTKYPLKTSATSNINKSNYSNQKETANERSKKVILSQNVSRQTVMKPCSSASSRKRNSSSQVRLPSLDSEGSISRRQSSITGPLHCTDVRQQWVSKYKIPRVKKSNGT